MEINKLGIYTDRRGRDVRVVAIDLPGLYPVVGVQMLNSGKGISKDGVRTYTGTGAYYSNGGIVTDELDLVSFKSCPQECMVDMEFLGLDSEVLAARTVVRDSDLHELLDENGWTEKE